MSSKFFATGLLVMLLYIVPPSLSNVCSNDWPKWFDVGFCECLIIFGPKTYWCRNTETDAGIITSDLRKLPSWAKIHENPNADCRNGACDDLSE